jgi:FAD/FMN-containing dehydrogenase
MNNILNDIQSKLNPTTVDQIIEPSSLSEIIEAVKLANVTSHVISVSGNMHSMGGQQFCSKSKHLDLRKFNRVIGFDPEKGHITVESGIGWPALIEYLNKAENQKQTCWAIRQKQTGIDHVTIGGSLSSNIHGRGLILPPFINDIDSFTLVDGQANLITCNRKTNAELFSLVIGGYGLFGIVAHITLRLTPRIKVKRVVELIWVRELVSKITKCAQEGALFGDCQYSINVHKDINPHPGILSYYTPVPESTPIPIKKEQLSNSDWSKLYQLARTDKQKAFDTYSQFYLKTSGQIYWSDTHQLSNVFDGYKDAVDVKQGTEVITEVYVSKESYLPFMRKMREDFLKNQCDMTYGTIRLIKKDTESYLAWAKEDSICIICNLNVKHTDEGIEKAKRNFRMIIDRVIQYGGSFYLTYHKWATKKQVISCYPKIIDFLRLKKQYDPAERFQSTWYKHYKKMFIDKLDP